MNPQSAAPSITDQLNPNTIAHVLVIGIILLVIYHFAFQR